MLNFSRRTTWSRFLNGLILSRPASLRNWLPLTQTGSIFVLLLWPVRFTSVVIWVLELWNISMVATKDLELETTTIKLLVEKSLDTVFKNYKYFHNLEKQSYQSWQEVRAQEELKNYYQGRYGWSELNCHPSCSSIKTMILIN